MLMAIFPVTFPDIVIPGSVGLHITEGRVTFFLKLLHSSGSWLITCFNISDATGVRARGSDLSTGFGGAMARVEGARELPCLCKILIELGLCALVVYIIGEAFF